ncbi:MAG: hypothetical protein KatS3mg042_1089 [Rhodothermaceae bacterium]|nr:MAG: hypothetical protein KatS3mg042_1089 [Rhodothermaceae bacterium]
MPVGRIVASVSLLTALLVVAGCDFTPDFHEFDAPEAVPEEETTACSGEGILCTVAGQAGQPGEAGDGGPAAQALLHTPVDVAMAPLTLAQTGEIFIVDQGSHRIRRVGPDGVITTYAGTGQAGDGDQGMATAAALASPVSTTIGLEGDLYIADAGNGKIKRVEARTGLISTAAGAGPGFEGDGGEARQARFAWPAGIAFDPDGLMYIGDRDNHRIRVVDLDATVTTLAGGEPGYVDGPALEARFHFPEGAEALPGGRVSMNTHDWVLYIADTENHRIRRYNFFTGEVTTIAGTGTPGYAGDGGAGRAALLNRPTDVIFTEDHRVYIADTGNHVIRKIDAFGTITTVAGTGTPGYSPDGTPAAEAMLDTPTGIFYDEVTRTLYIADTGNRVVRRIHDPY